ncbi:MAG: viperin family antiviral radical SAM protein [Planctomycetota bacterium]|nr:viperin family antiviral radical SAM protein [Planctomycetota bacterium]
MKKTRNKRFTPTLPATRTLLLRADQMEVVAEGCKATEWKLPASTVNLHWTNECNMRCCYCFATFKDIPDYLESLTREEIKELVRKLRRAGMAKLNVTGGEPILRLEETLSVLREAKAVGCYTSLGTNGAYLSTAVIEQLRESKVDMIALSIDLIVSETNEAIGRTVADRSFTHTDYLDLCTRTRSAGIKLKINTVVTTHNIQEDLLSFIQQVDPDRWKILQAINVHGQNEHSVRKVQVSSDDFMKYARKCRTAEDSGADVIVESEDMIRGSYIMIDRVGRFFDDTKGHHSYSERILEVGVEQAFKQVCFDREKYEKRNGDYLEESPEVNPLDKQGSKKVQP